MAEIIEKTPEELFLDNEKLIHFVMHRRGVYKNYDYISEDIEGELRVALWKSSIGFKYSRGVTFSTYAVYNLNNAINMYFRTFNKKVSRDYLMSELCYLSKDDGDTYDITDIIGSTESNIDIAIEDEHFSNLFFEALDYALNSGRRDTIQGWKKEDIRKMAILYFIHGYKSSELTELFKMKPRIFNGIFSRVIKPKMREYLREYYKSKLV